MRVSSRTPIVALAMFGVLLASYVVNAMDRQLFPLLVPSVRSTYGFSLADAGLLSTVFTLGMGLIGIPAGFLLSRWPRRLVVLLGIVLFSLATVLTAFAHGFWDMFAYRVVSGFGEALQLTALLAIGAAYFERHRAAAIGSVNACFALGAAIGPALGGALLASPGRWRVPLVVFGLLGFVALTSVALCVRPWLTESKSTGVEGDETAGARTLMNRNTLLLSGATVLGGLIIYGYLGMYPSFLRESLGFSGLEAGRVMSIFGLGALLSIAGGWFGDRVSPRGLLAGCFLGVAVLGFLLFHGPRSFAAQAAISFVWGVLASGSIYVNLAGYHVKAVRRKVAGRASGLFVAALYVPAAVSGYTIGWIATRYGWTAAGDVQLCLLSVLGAVLALALQPKLMDLARGKRAPGTKVLGDRVIAGR